MSCNRCNSNPCGCSVPYQIPGPMGPQGCPGPQGNPGQPGPTGPTGPLASTTYGQLYKTSNQNVTIVPTVTPVIWDGLNNGTNATIVPGSLATNSALRISKPGVYQLDWILTFSTAIIP